VADGAVGAVVPVVVRPRPPVPRFGIGLFAGGTGLESGAEGSDVGLLGRFRITPHLVLEGELAKSELFSGARVDRSWAGLYDMTPDAHPIIGLVGEGVYAACGFSGHGFMQSPAVGAAVAEELLDGASSFDLSPYRLERFAEDAVFPETTVL
jgi:glycine/D-amino acid oxidase-like deaminating enzyme